MTEKETKRYSINFIHSIPKAEFNVVGSLSIQALSDNDAIQMASAYLNPDFVQLLNIYRGDQLIELFPQKFRG